MKIPRDKLKYFFVKYVKFLLSAELAKILEFAEFTKVTFHSNIFQ